MTTSGRPLKYAAFIRALELEESYSVPCVVKHGEERGLFNNPDFRGERESLAEARGRVRTALNRLATHRLPRTEDCRNNEPGQPQVHAWYGWRWKRAIPEYFFEEAELRAIGDCEAKYRKQGKRMPRFDWFSLGRIFFSRKAKITMALVLATSMLTAGFVAVVYPEGARIFREEGPRAAFDFFRGSEQLKRRDPVVAFGKAWSNFAIGNFDEAEQAAYGLIKYSETPEVTIGNCFFLLGKIKTRTGFFLEARDHYQRAQSIFEALDRPANLFKNHIGLAEWALATDDLSEAETFINMALETNREAEMEPWDLFHLQAELAFRRGDFHSALASSYRYYSGYKNAGNVTKTADALRDIGFYLILTGQPDAGFEKTMEAQALVNKTGDQNKFYFCLINLMVLRRCEGKSYAVIEEALLNHIDEQRDQGLQNLLNFALTYSCETVSPNEGEGDEDPPPNTQ